MADGKEKDDRKPIYTVLPQKAGGGPKGLVLTTRSTNKSTTFPIVKRDPEDRSLRIVERESLVNKKIKLRIWHDLCNKELEACNACHHREGLPQYLWRCRDEDRKYKDCWAFWFRDEQLRKEITEEYLDDRCEYRRTGLTKKQRLLEAYQEYKHDHPKASSSN